MARALHFIRVRLLVGLRALVAELLRNSSVAPRSDAAPFAAKPRCFGRGTFVAPPLLLAASALCAVSPLAALPLAAAPPADSSATAPAATPPAAGETLSGKLAAVAKKVADAQKFELNYRMAAGESVRWKVTHLATVVTKIRGVEQNEKSRSVSTKVWRVKEVDAEGAITFVHSVENVDMWQSVSGRDDIRYNSVTDSVPPPQYEQVAKSLGIPLATITINRYGRILRRENAQPTFNSGIGELTVPLPEQPIQLGAQWKIPDELKVRLEDGRVQKIQTQQVYRLEKIESGVATISIRTQTITPVNDPKVESQLVERLKNGVVKFDMDAGRVISKQMDLDKEVVGFQGAESLMQYVARLTEELQTAAEPEVAARPTAPAGDAVRKTDEK